MCIMSYHCAMDPTRKLSSCSINHTDILHLGGCKMCINAGNMTIWNEPDLNQTHNFLIWSQTRYCCITGLARNLMPNNDFVMLGFGGCKMWIKTGHITLICLKWTRRELNTQPFDLESNSLSLRNGSYMKAWGCHLRTRGMQDVHQNGVNDPNMYEMRHGSYTKALLM
mgnify:CR=1 FL=1